MTSNQKDVTFDSWNTTDWAKRIPENALHEIFNRAETYASTTIKWYMDRKRTKALLARLIRGSAIFLAIFGSLAPVATGLVADADPALKLHLTQGGFLAIALAGGLVLADQFFGLSSGWIRYVMTATQIQTARENFNFDWANLMVQMMPASGGASIVIDAKTAAPLLERAHAFATTVRSLTEKETQTWATDFQASLADLQKLLADRSAAAETAVKTARDASDKATAAAAQATRTGSINISIDGASKPIEDAVVSLNGRQVGPLNGAAWSELVIAPGLVKVEIAGKYDGKPFAQSKTVEVTPGGIGTISFKFS